MIDSMNAKLEKFDSGWVGVSLALSTDEIELLLQRLASLKSGDITHFHLRSDDFSPCEGIADIEFCLIGEQEPNNMVID